WGSPVRAYNGSGDAFVAKLDSSGTLLWNTFLGGSVSDEGLGIATDSSGNIYVTGYSWDTWGSPIRAYTSGFEAFVAKLDSSGTLLWNTFLGGSNADFGFGIAADSSGNIFVAGNSSATWGSPIRAYSSDYDTFVAKLDSSGTLLWNTFLGSSSYDEGWGIAADSSGNIFVTGESLYTWGSPVRAHSSGDDAFVAKLDSSGTLLWNTFLGGSDEDDGYGIATDSSGNIYVTGLSNAAWGSPIRAYSSSSDAFVAKLYQTPPPPLTNYYYVDSTVTGEGGSVDKKHRMVEEGDNVKINIFPDEGYEIDKIYDNGVEMTVANPYVIKNITEDHRVEITFKRILYPPVLSLTGERKTEKAWIIKKDYTELNISITEDEYPMVVAAYTLFKKVNGTWVGIKNFSGPGSYEYTEKYIKSGESVSYKLAAIAPDGTVISESSLTL
ncbi:MAG: SBBP repeat-containing protein, partial [Acidobacteriota bacterium]